MGRKVTTDSANVCVHVLHNGRALCGFSRMLPRDWPAGHVWVGIGGASQASCTRCQRGAKELIEQDIERRAQKKNQ